jgi:hypothetical protein
VAYVPDWEPLADALKRVMAAGISEDQAKPDLCNAVADRKICVRVTLARRGQVFSGGNVGVPSHLAPTDFDWELSRPLRPWPIGPVGPQNYTWLSGWEDQPIALVEISTVDVINVLCGGEVNRKAQRAAPAGAKARGVLEAINQLWPGEIPEGLSAKERDNAIREQLSKNKSSAPQDLARAVQRALKARMAN